MQLKYLFNPLIVGNMELRNRIVMPAIQHVYAPSGFVNKRLIDYYTARAAGGAGLLIIGGCAIDKVGRGTTGGMLRLDQDEFIPGLKELAVSIHNQGAKLCAQLYHAGRYTHSRIINQTPIAPSAIASRLTGDIPREMTEQDITDVIESFVNAAERAKKAGFDAIEIIGSAGYLISQFLSPITNVRTDMYGGSFENRMRFGLKIVAEVKNCLGNYPVFVRISGNDFMSGGNTNTEAVAFAIELEKVGVDCINVTGGWHETSVPQMTGEVPNGAFVYLAAAVKEAVQVPVIASNRINDPFLGEEILAMGQADLINMGRGLIADPELPYKAQMGKFNEIRRCIGCSQGCTDRTFNALDIMCTVNAFAGHEHELSIKPADKVKRVLVIGGGPAGMEVAIIAAKRGHKVQLWEKSERLGGQILYACKPHGKKDFIQLVEQQSEMLKALKVDVIINKIADENAVLGETPDVVVVATGATPIVPPFEVAEGSNIMQANDVLAGTAIPGKRVVVIGGGAVGCETAVTIADQGTINAEILKFLMVHEAEDCNILQKLVNTSAREVTIVEMMKGIGRDIGKGTRWTIMKHIKRLGIKKIDEGRVVAVTPKLVRVNHNGELVEIPADSVILAVGSKENNAIAITLKGKVKELHVVGDAVKPRRLLEAMAEATEVALTI